MCYIPDQNDLNVTNCSGVVIPSKKIEESTDIVLSSPLITVDEFGKMYISAIIPTFNQITVSYNTIIATFEIRNPTLAEKLFKLIRRF